MKITLENTGKKYNREWIFKDMNLEFSSSNSYVVSGGNGSGKSTFLKVISGFNTPTKGKIIYKENTVITGENIFAKISYTSPYISVFEAYNIKELFEFYTKFKQLKDNISYKEFVEIIELSSTKGKAIKHFSSGMKQRVKLGLAILSQTPILLLDEPTSNLDKKAINWYKSLIENNLEDRLVFVASNNQKDEFFFCENEILIEDYKK